MPKVSIIMGIYNCADTLDEAIESILQQTYTDWEMIMCDDASSDQTYECAQKYVEKDPNKFILLRNEKNLGLNETLNKCLKIAKGEYVARMDGDDISLPTRFEKEVQFLDNHPKYAIVSTPMIFFDESGDWGQNKQIEIPQTKDFIHHSPFHCHAPCMIRREAYMKVGGYSTDKRTLRFEDCDLWYKLYAAGYRGYNIQEPLYKMRDDKEAIHRRTFRSRLNAVYVKYIGFKRLNVPKSYYIWVIYSLFMAIGKGILPYPLYKMIHHKRLRNE